MKKKIVCGIVGCGVVSTSHAESFKECGNTKIKWACDLIPERAEKLANKFGIEKTTVNFEEMLDDPELDCISVCTDHGSHPEICAKALAKGKHVLCEKALAASAEGLDMIGTAVKKSPGTVFSGVFQHRFDALSRFLKHLVDSGAFGTVLTSSTSLSCIRTNEYYQTDAWRGTWKNEGGALMINQAIHFVDLTDWIMGGVESLSGEYANLTHEGVIEAEDTAVASLRFKSGALGVISATSSSTSEWDIIITITGASGMLTVRKSAILEFEFLDPAVSDSVRKFIANPEDDNTFNPARHYYGKGHPAQIADFINAIRTGQEPFIPFHSARRAVDIVLGIYKSSQEGKTVKIL